MSQQIAAIRMTIAVENYLSVIEEIKPLLREHWLEIANFKDSIPLDPDWAKYQAMEAAGMLVIITMRRGGKLVGYSIFMLLNHPHYQSTLFAMNDILYLVPAERRGLTGIRLIKESERILMKMNVKKITWHLKPQHDFSPILKRMGYMHEEICMGKVL